MAEVNISEQDLDYVIQFCAKKLVGKVCKRFEIHDNLPVLKVEIKELLYEGTRDMKDLILATSKGLKPKVYSINKGESSSS